MGQELLQITGKIPAGYGLLLLLPTVQLPHPMEKQLHGILQEPGFGLKVLIHGFGELETITTC